MESKDESFDLTYPHYRDKSAAPKMKIPLSGGAPYLSDIDLEVTRVLSGEIGLLLF